MASWHTFSLVVPRSALQALARGLLQLGATGTQEDFPPGHTPRFRQPWDKGPAPRPPKKALLKAWFTTRPSEAAIAAIVGDLGTPEWSMQSDEDWSETWKQHFHTLRISDRLIITPPWEPVEGALVIEPGNAFGTGEHATTRACLRAIDRLATPGGTCLDVGTGSGILALAAAKLGMVVEGNDIDPDAVVAAREAAAANGLPANFHARPLEAIEGRYTLVVANLFAEVLAGLAPHLCRVTAEHLVLTGILADRAALVKAAFAPLPMTLEEEGLDEGWVWLVYRAQA